MGQAVYAPNLRPLMRTFASAVVSTYGNIKAHLTSRLNIGAFFSQGLVFSRPNSPAYIARLEISQNDVFKRIEDPARIAEILSSPERPNGLKIIPKAPHEIAKILIAESARPNSRSAATLYIDTLPAFLEGSMPDQGYTVIDILKMNPGQMEDVLSFARANGVTLDYHAPWLSKTTAGKYHYPTPKTHRDIFDKLTQLAKLHQRIFGEKPQITIHMTGKPEDWQAWVEETSQHAQIIVENAFVMNLSGSGQSARNISNDFEYFLHSDFHAPQEFIEWVRALGIEDVCFDQAHAFAGYRNVNGGVFDPIGDLKFLGEVIDAGLNIARFHRASVPRELAGQERGSRVIIALDTHGKITPFTREWFLKEYSKEAQTVNHVFDRLGETDAQEKIRATFEILPAEAVGCVLADFETVFS